MKSKVGRAIAGGLLSAIVTAGILEIAIRVIRPIPDNVPMTYHAAAGDEDYAPDPYSSVRSIFGILHRTDSRGLRGPERPLARAAGRARVAVVGDSVVWGFGIPEENTVAASLERLARAGGLKLEAWNLGVEAYNTYNENGRYARLAPLVRPDVTIVVVLFNDLQAKAEHFRITSVGTLADPRLSAPYPDEWRPALEKSALFHAAIRLYWHVAPPGSGAFDLKNLPGVLRQLDEIGRTAAGVGSALVVAAMPSAWPDPEHFAALADGLRRFCSDRNIAFVDLSTRIGRPARRDLLLPADPVHPTADGAELIAEALLPAVEQALKKP
jgi:lysophospholipase L1-like esterase